MRPGGAVDHGLVLDKNAVLKGLVPPAHTASLPQHLGGLLYPHPCAPRDAFADEKCNPALQ
jgi:hypothetical protein